jgi:hypothetical protein
MLFLNSWNHGLLQEWRKVRHLPPRLDFWGGGNHNLKEEGMDLTLI